MWIGKRRQGWDGGGMECIVQLYIEGVVKFGERHGSKYGMRESMYDIWVEQKKAWNGGFKGGMEQGVGKGEIRDVWI